MKIRLFILIFLLSYVGIVEAFPALPLQNQDDNHNETIALSDNVCHCDNLHKLRTYYQGAFLRRNKLSLRFIVCVDDISQPIHKSESAGEVIARGM